MKKTLLIFTAIIILALILLSVGRINTKATHTPESDLKLTTEFVGTHRASVELPPTTKAVASWYNYDLNRKDQKCKTDDCYSMFNSTCASRDYKRGTILTVKYKNKEIQCIVNDYIEHPERDIDLSSYAFKQLAPLSVGLINVEISNIK